MTVMGISYYLAGALVYAALVTGAVFIVVTLWRGRWPSAGFVLLVLLSSFILFLGLHPFPERAALDCSDGGAAPLLTPFGFLDRFEHLWRKGAPLPVWLRDVSVMSSIMNFVFFAMLGAGLAARRLSAGAALLFLCGLSGLIEISQITALFGLYPCPYRHFEIDDLILNVWGGWPVSGFGASDGGIEARGHLHT